MQREKQSLSVCLFSCMSVIEMSISNYINNTAMSEFAALHAVCKHQVVSKSSSFEVLTNYQNYTLSECKELLLGEIRHKVYTESNQVLLFQGLNLSQLQ